jgi:molybdate transport system substrate-binding protein
VFAAASAAGIVEELGGEFERESGIPVRVSAASSSVLAKQIEEGAPADLFLSAHPEWLDHLAAAGRLDRASARLFARNSLVIVAAPGGPTALPAPPAAPERIAVADPAHVPLGRYARQALERSGRWETWGARLLPALDAAAAVEYVRRGEVPVGILYRTDALAHPELCVLEEIDPALHEPVELRIAPIAGGDPRSELLLEFLTGAIARERLAARGFTVDPPIPARGAREARPPAEPPG